MKYGDYIITCREPGSHSLEIYQKGFNYKNSFMKHITEQQAKDFVIYAGHDPDIILPQLKKMYLAKTK